MFVVNQIKKIIILTVLLSLVACSFSQEYKGVYKKDTEQRPLQVPPDLSTPVNSGSMDFPGLTPSGATYNEYLNKSGKQTVLPGSISGIRLVRDGAMLWLEIDATPDEIWPEVKIFFRDLGFKFVRNEPMLGIMETNWLENRADIPTGWFASLFGSIYSSGLMDKYRIRLERSETDKSKTLMFITHQGLKETSYGSLADSELEVKWEPRESDPELEAEMLQRYLIFRGVTKHRAKSLISNSTQVLAKLIEKDGTSSIEITGTYARTWRRIGLVLDRIGLIVEDRNRSQGIFYIKTTEEFLNKEDKSWVSSLFTSNKDELKVDQFRLVVNDNGDTATLFILDKNGVRDKGVTAHYIMKSLADHLR